MSGCIDFSKADPQNKQWYLRYRLLFHEFINKENLELLKIQQNYLGSLLSLQLEDKQDIIDKFVDTFNKVLHNRYPWEVDEEESVSQDIIAAFREKYGEETDPRYQSLVNEWREALAKVKEKSSKKEE